ncbi:MAG TPA: stage II sporulation protein M [Firmicutes bacterium]|nr:stage II sporulation protein M [Bacillota bacterium]
MSKLRFVESRRPDWLALQMLVERLDEAPGSLTPDEVRRLGPLYQAAVADLAYLKQYYPADQLVNNLQTIVTRAHRLLTAHATEAASPAPRVWLRPLARAFMVAALLYGLGAAYGSWAWLRQDPWGVRALTPPVRQLARELQQSRWQSERTGSEDAVSDATGSPEVSGPSRTLNAPELSAYVLTNNVRVAMLAFALGLTWGLGTAMVLFYNGIILGALGAAAARGDQAALFWSVILPHGVVELPAVWLAGASGLYIAGALIRPGPYPRLPLLVRHARNMVPALLTVIAMLVLAAGVEGFISPRPTLFSVEFKYALAGGFTLIELLAALLVFAPVVRRSASGRR